MADDIDPGPRKRRPTWVSVVLAIVIVVVVLVLTLIGGGIYFFNRHVSSQSVSVQSAEGEFEQARRRFAGQHALIELPRTFDDSPVIHRREVRAATPAQTLYVMVYDHDEGKIVRITIPFWLLRMMSVNGHFRLAQLDLFESDDRARLTMDDLERQGTGLVLDHRDRRGTQVLLWTE